MVRAGVGLFTRFRTDRRHPQPAPIAEGAARLRALGAGRRAGESFAGDLLDVADLIGET